MRDTRTEGANRHLADNLRALRERKGISQPALAEAMKERGIAWHQQTVGRVEAGQQRVKWDEAVALSAIFSVPLERFTWPPGEANAADALYASAERIRHQARELVKAVGSLLSARRLAERAQEDTAKYVSPRVDDARETLADVLGSHDLVDVVNEGIRGHAERFGSSEEGDGDGGDAEENRESERPGAVNAPVLSPLAAPGRSIIGIEPPPSAPRHQR